MKRRNLMQATMAAGMILGAPRFLSAVTGRPAPGTRRRGLATGIGDLDGLLGGLRPGEVVVLTGAAGAGKTCLAAQVAAHAAAGLGVPVAFFSMDDASDDVRLRMACQMACVDFVRERVEPLTEGEERRLASARGMLDRAPLSIETLHEPGPEAFARLVRDRARRGGARLLVVDPHPGLAGEDAARGKRGAAFGRLLRDLAVELGIAILAVSPSTGDDAGAPCGGDAGRMVTLRRVGVPDPGGLEEREIAVREAGRTEAVGQVRLCLWPGIGRFWSRGVGEAARAALCREDRLVCAG